MSNYGRGRKSGSLCEEENFAIPVLEHVLNTAAQEQTEPQWDDCG